ncbi:hypothetical protein K3495_g15380 [Podosphaera aphanis]|nr:hypothetical protein K3495_g15380 [Podosphaera aphanis]
MFLGTTTKQSATLPLLHCPKLNPIFSKRFNTKTKSIRADNGGEYVCEKLTNYFKQKGINHYLTPPYSPESNGVAERLNRSIGEGVRAILLSLSEKRLWAEAVKTFIYTKNRQFHKTVTGMTPYEAFHGEIPSTDHLQPFGRKCFVHIPKNTSNTWTNHPTTTQQNLVTQNE